MSLKCKDPEEEMWMAFSYEGPCVGRASTSWSSGWHLCRLGRHGESGPHNCGIPRGLTLN
jgi:hypothetical protein